FKMVTLRPCDTGFDQRMKASITSKLMGLFPAVGKFVFKNFKLISWIFVISFFFSIAAMGYGVYNYVLFGNCNGPEASGFCIFNGLNISTTISIKDIPLAGHPVRGNQSAPINLIEFACFECSFSKQAEPVVKQILATYPDKVKFTFFFFPLPQHKNGQLAARAALCADEQGKFWEYHDILFEKQSSFSDNVDAATATTNMKTYATQLGLNMTEFNDCFDNLKTQDRVLQDYQTATKLGLQGTPTFYIGDKELVGPQTFETFQQCIIQ
ncbi:MAG: thioredoxin domain-containing protein, partial [Candidatus Aenigmatarchaeota archaeon]